MRTQSPLDSAPVNPELFGDAHWRATAEQTLEDGAPIAVVGIDRLVVLNLCEDVQLIADAVAFLADVPSETC